MNWIASLAETTPPEVFQGLMPSIIVLVGSILTVGVLTFFISYFGYFPTKKYLNNRKNYIQKNLDTAVKMNNDAQILFQKSDEKYKNSQNAANQMFEQAKTEAKEYKNKLISDANIEVKKIIEISKSKVELETKKIKQEMSENFVDLTLQAAEKLIKENLNSTKNNQLIMDFLTEFEQKDGK